MQHLVPTKIENVKNRAIRTFICNSRSALLGTAIAGAPTSLIYNRCTINNVTLEQRQLLLESPLPPALIIMRSRRRRAGHLTPQIKDDGRFCAGIIISAFTGAGFKNGFLIRYILDVYLGK